MLLASQTTAENPTLWVCHAAIAKKLRCSPITVKRSIQKLVDAKLIVETGDLHERRFKFYRVRWSLTDNRPVTRAKKVATTAKKVVTPAQAGVQRIDVEDWMPAPSQGGPYAGMTKKKPAPKPTESTPPPHPGIDLSVMLKDSRIAHWAEIARQKHEENLKRYRMEVRMLEHLDIKASDDVVENTSYET